MCTQRPAKPTQKEEIITRRLRESGSRLILFIPPVNSKSAEKKAFKGGEKGIIPITMPDTVKKKIIAPHTVKILFMEFARTFEKISDGLPSTFVILLLGAQNLSFW